MPEYKLKQATLDAMFDAYAACFGRKVIVAINEHDQLGDPALRRSDDIPIEGELGHLIREFKVNV